MLILLLCAVSLWLWIPSPANVGNVPSRPLKFLPFGRAREQRTELAGSNDARIVRELSALLRSGLGFHAALEALIDAEEDNSSMIQALKNLQATQRFSTHSAQRFITDQELLTPAVKRLQWCLALSERSGASLSEVLERLADDLESALVAQQAFEAAMAGPKATTKLLTWLPLAGFGFGMLVGIDVVGTIVTSWAAQLSVLIGAGLWITNRLWCQRLMRSTTRQALS